MEILKLGRSELSLEQTEGRRREGVGVCRQTRQTEENVDPFGLLIRISWITSGRPSSSVGQTRNSRNFENKKDGERSLTARDDRALDFCQFRQQHEVPEIIMIMSARRKPID